jgi:hypothetical protein
MDDEAAASADLHASAADEHAEGADFRKKKPIRKKRKASPEDAGEEQPAKKQQQTKKANSKKKKDTKDADARKKPRKPARKAQFTTVTSGGEELSAAQIAANEQMRKVLEEDCYSAIGSIVESGSEDEDAEYHGRGAARLDRSAILSAMRKRVWMERMSGSAVLSVQEDEEQEEDDVDDQASRSSRKAKTKKKHRKKTRPGDESLAGTDSDAGGDSVTASDMMSVEEPRPADTERDEGSIFGATAGASNATWVECDKCKKWRRLRGVIDEKKLPPKWYCSMNKNDPERSRCSAPEEDYEQSNTPESQADARTRKHFRIWVQRLKCNEAYESRQPTMTRGKKRNATMNSKEPYQWVRCCNPSCGKWRSLLRCMDAKSNVLDRTTDGLWYCVMNTWDEKIASCAAPQENLPAVGCPQWVLQDEG